MMTNQAFRWYTRYRKKNDNARVVSFYISNSLAKENKSHVIISVKHSAGMLLSRASFGKKQY